MVILDSIFPNSTLLRLIQVRLSKNNYFIFTVLFCAIQLSVTFGGSVFAQTWTGSNGTDWNDAGNWSGGIPTAGASVSIPNRTNKPIINTSVTIASLTVGNWSNTTPLTVITGGDLEITNSLTFRGGGQLHIDGGDVHLSGSSFSASYSATSFIEMTSGSFTSDANMNITNGNNSTQPGFVAGSGAAIFNGTLTVANSKLFKAEDADSVYVGNTFTVNGTYNGDDGKTVIDGSTTVGSGGTINLDDGILKFNASVFIGNNGTTNFGSGTVFFEDDVDVASSGFMNVEDATVNVIGNADFSNNGNLTVADGTINVGGDASISSGGSIELGGGNLNLEGDFSVTGGSTFEADSSTVTFSGDSTQTVTASNNITFFNVNVDSGAVFNTDGGTQNTVTIEGDLVVDEDGGVEIQDDDQLDVQGEVTGDGADNVNSPAPFAISAVATNSITIVITFNKAMEETAVENTSNYSIARVNNPGSTLSVSSAVLNTGGDSKQVTLTVSSITDDIEYEITMNSSGNIESVDGGELSTNHKKRFTKVGPIVFYSLTSGNWSTNSTWSRTSHSGSAATSNPNSVTNATIIIGDGDVVTISNSVSISNQTSVQVTSYSRLTVGLGGTLTTGTKTITGAGTFEVTNGTLQIGSPSGISSSGSTGNIRTTTRIFSSTGNYTYNGNAAQVTGSGLPSAVANLQINNSSDVTLDADITVNGTLTLTDGSLIVESGNNLIANTKSITSGDLIMRHEVTGSNGWRLLSSPINSDYDDFLDGIVTQGYTGAYYSTGSNPGDTLQPNVLYYDETYPGTDNQRWRAPTNASNSLTEGRGLFTYIFGDIDTDPNYNDILPFPVTLEVQGNEFEGPVDFDVTYTATADSGWNLVGNPYAASIDWDNSSNWTKTNIDGTIYLWDYDQDQFITWNGTTGDLGNGLIAPFQGFWVKANAASPSLIVNEDAKTTGGSFVGKIANQVHAHPSFSIRAVSEQKEASTHFMFSSNARMGKDVFDGYRLQPFSGLDKYLNISSVSSSGEQFAINNLPRDFGVPIEIPITLEVYDNEVLVEDNLYFKFEDLENIPVEWTLLLIDTHTGEQINIRQQPTYIFTHQGTHIKQKATSELSTRPKLMPKVNPKSTRFILQIDPGEDASNLPQTFTLSQNYPNPFNPETKIDFSLPIQGSVQLIVYDLLGRQIATLANAEFNAGKHTVRWNANNVATGIYIYRLVTQQGVFTKKMTLIK